ncbi:MAG: HPF/RaiA family ribosome-associated protein [Planctomycetota bacterium]|jgi:ribosome-associated translation inhibitor RaiA
MQVPVQVTFRDMPVSDAVEATCWDEAAKLERCFDRIKSCRIVVAASNGRRPEGSLVEIRIVLAVPGRELVVDRRPPPHQADEDVSVAVREAFDTARRLLEDYLKRRQREAHLKP